MLKFMVVAIAAVLMAAATTDGWTQSLPGSLHDWTASGDEQVYRNDDLFLYMNGGAEIYHEYGFDCVTVRDYHRGDDRLGVEIYTMTDGAFGIFTFTRSDSADRVDLGDDGSLAEYYATFRAGDHLVVVTAQTELDDVRSEVLKVAMALASRYHGGGPVPSLMNRLPAENRLPSSEKYIAGPLAMRNISPLVGRLLRGFKEAGAARYKGAENGEELLIILSWASPAAATASMKTALAASLADNGARVERRNEDGFMVFFDSGPALDVTRIKEFVTVVEKHAD